MAKPQLTPMQTQLEELRLLEIYCVDQAKAETDRDKKARWTARAKAAGNAWWLQNSIMDMQTNLAR